MDNQREMRAVAEVIGKIDWPGAECKGFAGGPRGELCVLMAAKRGSPRWRVSCFSGNAQRDYAIDTTPANFRFAQPMPEGILLCGARQSGTSANARIYDPSGRLIREFPLGDGIADLQATSSGGIWVSYFDEGVFGSTVAAAGLARFDSRGTRTYAFQSAAHPEGISDCYALDVVSEGEVWFYYYTPFPLVKLVHGATAGTWRPDIAGAHSFAVWDNLVVIHAGYRREDWRVLLLGDDGSHVDLGSLECVDEHGLPLPASSACARSRHIWFLRNSTVYRVDIAELEG